MMDTEVVKLLKESKEARLEAEKLLERCKKNRVH